MCGLKSSVTKEGVMEKPRYGMGWQRGHVDLRDLSPDSEDIQTILPKGSKALKAPKAGLPTERDLSDGCSPIENQGDIGSCTAHAGVGLMEYYERRAFSRHIDASRLFLYKVTRTLLHWTGDTGAWLRTTMKAMRVFGVPPEEYYPYVAADFDNEPPAFCYSFAQNFQSIKYYRLDPAGTSPEKLLARIRQMLAAGYPCMFGFSVYNYGNDQGEFTYPSADERLLGGHAVMAVGYDDKRKIGKTKGALKIRNSWGTSWGENGYGWLPYKYVEAGLAEDFWSLFKQEYVATNQFE